MLPAAERCEFLAPNLPSVIYYLVVLANARTDSDSELFDHEKHVGAAVLHPIRVEHVQIYQCARSRIVFSAPFAAVLKKTQVVTCVKNFTPRPPFSRRPLRSSTIFFQTPISGDNLCRHRAEPDILAFRFERCSSIAFPCRRRYVHRHLLSTVGMPVFSVPARS